MGGTDGFRTGAAAAGGGPGRPGGPVPPAADSLTGGTGATGDDGRDGTGGSARPFGAWRGRGAGRRTPGSGTAGDAGTSGAPDAGLAGDTGEDAGIRPSGERSGREGLLDLLGVAAMVLDSDGRIVLWSPQAEELLGYRAEEVLGRFAVRVLVSEDRRELVLDLFARVMRTGSGWAGVFPVRHRTGASRLLEFRTMRLLDDAGDLYALGLATDQLTLRDVERDLALSVRMVDQSPIGLGVLGTDLRYVGVNAALERLDGVSAAGHVGRRVGEVAPFLGTAGTEEAAEVEEAMREVLATGVPLVDRQLVGRTPADPDRDRAWSLSFYRLEDVGGHVLGLALSVIDVTDRHRAALEAEQARHRLAVVADASVRIGTTLDLEQTARELAAVAVPELADVAAVDLLETVLAPGPGRAATEGPAVIRALAVAAAYPTVAVEAADPPGEPAHYGADRLVTRCVRTARPVTVAAVDDASLARIARDRQAAELLARAGVHSYLAVPLIARGEVLGALDLKRARNPLPFTEDDVLLASELAARAAVCIDNARLYRRQRDTALTLQRSMLAEVPAGLAGLEVASRYEPAGSGHEVGGDWFDVIPVADGTTALVVGDVMGSGIGAATTMGRLSTATRTLARLSLDPAEVLRHLDGIIEDLEPAIATCVYAVYDPARQECRIATAGHLPPVLIRSGQGPRLLDLPTGAPLGVGGVAFHTVTTALAPGDRLVLYTDGLVETRDQDIDTRLATLLRLLGSPDPSLEATCDRLLRELRRPLDQDDVALLVARADDRRPR
ncbi:SpoIIE family protein phosphatase [Streptomyces sp. LP05-1]|uniref:SpoIIE family protein phosphatase n=1 Tax=Streptomyces pyxinae TaxID=2970734 RepID=A0ABT2CH94_9ACTN|nr:SpoIIE family protein phosphatase [Streptomyces sp. LP05-1]MCS0636788.1 SpoIIE family protein phosphatase [Streptomyces sp. LP05-1]